MEQLFRTNGKLVILYSGNPLIFRRYERETPSASALE